MMQVDPALLIKAIKNGQNPQQLILNVLEGQMAHTPMGANLLNLARQGNTKEIEKIARNYYSSQGLDYDKEFAAFKRMLGVK